jgi:hypothetical protein
MDKRDRTLALEFKKRLPADLKAHLKHLIVFGILSFSGQGLQEKRHGIPTLMW